MVLPVMKKATTAVVGLTANAAGAEALAGAATGRASDAGNWRRELRDKQLQQSTVGLAIDATRSHEVPLRSNLAYRFQSSHKGWDYVIEIDLLSLILVAPHGF